MFCLKELLPYVNSEVGVILSWIGMDDKSTLYTHFLQSRLSFVPAVGAGDTLQETLVSEDLWNGGVCGGMLTMGLWVGLRDRELS